MKGIRLHTELTKKTTVGESMLASHVNSGIVDVCATPMMIALMENTAAACLNQFLEEGETSVGVTMRTTHDTVTSTGMTVTAEVEITAADRKKVSSHIIARDERDLIGIVDHDCFIVKKEAFEAKALSKLEDSQIHVQPPFKILSYLWVNLKQGDFNSIISINRS